MRGCLLAGLSEGGLLGSWCSHLWPSHFFIGHKFTQEIHSEGGFELVISDIRSLSGGSISQNVCSQMLLSLSGRRY